MKNLILVAVILQLVITIKSVDGEEYKFGDIIVFPRKCLYKGAKPIYNHYAIYVGPSSVINVNQSDNDIVHRTGASDKSNCRFDKLANARGTYKDKKTNYLDGIDDDNNGKYSPGTTEEIKERIGEALKNCATYNLFTNNCEHFSTFVRYGHPKTLQAGAVSQCFVVISRKANALLRRIRDDTKEEATCEKRS